MAHKLMVLPVFQISVSAVRVRIVSYEVCELPFMHKETEFPFQIQSGAQWSLQPAVL